MEAGHVERDGERYLVPDPGSLLEAWADAAAPPRNWIGLPVEESLRDGASIDGLDVVSPQQVYVDLARAAGRGRQAGEEVRRQLLRYLR